MIRITVLNTFQKAVKKLLKDDDIKVISGILQDNPKAGDVIKGTGGARKLRYAIAGRGKRGGMRIIYYFVDSDNHIVLITGYAKNRQADITSSQLKLIAEIVKNLKQMKG